MAGVLGRAVDANAAAAMKSILAAMLLALSPHANADALSVDLPHGGCRLTIFDDGGGSIGYGAMPRSAVVPPGTFDIRDVASSLAAHSHAQDQVPIRPQSGSVSLPGASELRSIQDAPRVRALLEQAWEARVVPATAREQEDERWVGDACAFTDPR
nr:hypothetical protein [Panacagrimonas sp.]